MKVVYNVIYGYTIENDCWKEINASFQSIQALENHIKLMLITVQNYKESENEPNSHRN